MSDTGVTCAMPSATLGRLLRRAAAEGVQVAVPQFSVNGETYFSTKDVADLLGVAPSTVRSLIERGVLQDVPKVTHVTRKQRGFSEAWLREAALTLGRRLPTDLTTGAGRGR
jgi:hypothetical protein